MYSRQHTPPSSYGSYCQDVQTSFEAPSGYLTPDASPECGLPAASTPARSPIRQHGPLLLPKIRSQDQTTEPSTSGPIRHRRTASAASGISNYNPYARPSSVGRRSTSPLSNASVGSPAPSSMLSAYDAGFGSGLNSPINLSRRPSMATHSRSHSASGVRSHSRSSSATSIDESVINRYGYPTYRNLPNYVTQTSAAQAASYNLATAMPMNSFPLQTTASFEDQIPAVAPPVQQPLAAELQYGAFDQPAATTTLLDYLTGANPSPALVQRVTTGARNLTGSHYWWDIRNLRSWDDFNIETISSIPGLMPLLQIPIDAMSLPTPPKANMMPESESALHDIVRDYYGTKISAALNIAQGNTHMSLRSRKGLPTNQTPVDFVSNYPTDYEKTIYGDQRGRVVGIVKAYDQWNTGMRSEAPNKQVYYLAGLAHLHRVMREHGCRYGFIMTEIEMLCVRCGGDPSDPGQTMDTATVSADAGSGVPLFGYLELSAPIRISTHGLRVDSETGEQTPQMTAGLALWYLHMLAKENPLPGIQGSWRMEVGGPAALTRQHCQEKDAWIPKPNLSEKREAKRLRGWVFPDEPLNRKELGKSKRSRSSSSERRRPSRVSQIAGHLNYPKGLLAGQVAIITGSGQGIGAETAKLFANEGAKVVVSDLDGKKAQEVAQQINESGGSAIAVPGDMLDDKYIDELVKKAAEFGNGKIHIIVNNAGFTWDGVIHKTTDKQWDTILALHNTAPFKLVRAAAPYFRVKDGEPRNIINISSTSGLHGNAGQANYALAKAGVVGLSKTIAKEWGPQFNVRANTVAFGHILTRLTAAKEDGAFVTTPDGSKVALGIPKAQGAAKAQGGFPDIPLGRPGTATEAASAILAVASPLFSYVSGQTISVTGGRNI